MTSQTPTAFDSLMTQISGFPLWIKQVIYVQLRLELETSLTRSTLDTFGHGDTLQLMLPQITHFGKKELEQPSGKCSQGLMKLLYLSNQGKTVMNICLTNQWTLEQCAIFLLDAMEKQLISPPTSGIIDSTIQYLGNRIRLGEYLVKIGRLSFEQLDQALRTQKYIEEALGEKTGIANVLINLGYINKQDSEGILFLKEESRKNFTGVIEASGASPSSPANSVDMETFIKVKNDLRHAIDRIRQLEYQNEQLMQQKR